VNTLDKSIYLADDDALMREYLHTFLVDAGYNVSCFETGDELLDEFRRKPCDLVILDVVMPGNSGFTICALLKQISAVPIIILAAQGGESDYVTGITLGSDIFLEKPFKPAILAVHIKSLLGKSVAPVVTPLPAVPSNELVFADLVLSPSKFSATCNNVGLNLTHSEFNLLTYLIEHQDRAVSRDELLRELWGYDKIVETRATDDTVKRLRKKLITVNSKVSVSTVWGFGFRLDVGE